MGFAKSFLMSMSNNDWIGYGKWKWMKLKDLLPCILARRALEDGCADVPYTRTSRSGRVQVEAALKPVLWSSGSMTAMPWATERMPKPLHSPHETAVYYMMFL